ncbi:MAG TPA: hypothetical protein VH350_12580 [Candidatus Sulfotelmatobacter sp.]|nr:hypothetical protein [Candidatus Sulfotelmatobacter sp.]
MSLALMRNTVIFSGGMAVSVEMQQAGILVSKQMLEPSSNMPWPTGLETGGVRFWAPRRMIDGRRSSRIDSTGGLA